MYSFVVDLILRNTRSFYALPKRTIGSSSLMAERALHASSTIGPRIAACPEGVFATLVCEMLDCSMRVFQRNLVFFLLASFMAIHLTFSLSCILCILSATSAYT
eukprot:TRINITY_DN10740_c0_g1_i15.p1 TRINITY_DN10740_c0_g1~~TRINITY_DN10740_c0_g1_i15.p1  ORF type:complete len:104 (-),score=3.51 TRINITY_DN10740_c0_g1_i15:178-489(-)